MIIKNQVIAGFNRGAKTYTQAADLQAQIAKSVADQLLNSSAHKILEIGCGTGLLTRHLFKMFPQADFVLTDISSQMIAQCRQEVTESSNIEWVCVDGEELDSSQSFDLIVSSMTMHWFKEFESSLINIKQKLKKGGRLLFAMLAENSLCEWREMCGYFNYPIATPLFPAVVHLQNQFPELKLNIKTMKKTYPDAHTFLNTLKSIGATATRAGYLPLSSDKLRKILRHFNHEIEITYEVVYGEYLT